MGKVSKVYMYLPYTFLAISIILFFIFWSALYSPCDNSEVNSSISNVETNVAKQLDSASDDFCDNLTATQLVCHLDAAENYICVGEVTNNCNRDFNFVKVIGTYYRDNEIISTSFTFVTTTGIKSHQSSPFSLYTTENSIIFEDYELQIVAS